MNTLNIGIRLESLGLSLRRALTETSHLNVLGVQVDAAGELSPGALSQTGRRGLRHLLRVHNLRVTALGCPMPRGLDDAEDLQSRVEQVRKVLTLSVDLGAHLAVVQAGAVPDELNSVRGALLLESLFALGQYGDHIGARLVLETGLESGATLAAFLSGLDTGGLAADMNPANLLEHGFDPYDSVRALQGRILHSHARDVRCCGPNRAAQEVPLGQGDVDWAKYLNVLDEVGYRGWLIVERGPGSHRLSEVAEGVVYLRRLLE